MREIRTVLAGDAELLHLRRQNTDLRRAGLSVRAESHQLTGSDDPFGSQGPPILVGANAYFCLVAALGNPTQQEARRAIRGRTVDTGETDA